MLARPPGQSNSRVPSVPKIDSSAVSRPVKLSAAAPSEATWGLAPARESDSTDTSRPPVTNMARDVSVAQPQPPCAPAHQSDTRELTRVKGDDKLEAFLSLGFKVLPPLSPSRPPSLLPLPHSSLPPSCTERAWARSNRQVCRSDSRYPIHSRLFRLCVNEE